MTDMRVIQVTDSLALGGLERVAINLANGLAADHFRSYLCATRVEGPLKEQVAHGVKQICLRRTGRLGLSSVLRLGRYIADEKIEIAHAHGTSLFITLAASIFSPRVKVIWHDHFGRLTVQERPSWIYGPAARRAAGIIAVNTALADWSRQRLHVPGNKVWYVPNFVFEPKSCIPLADLPGQNGFRLVCIANFRPQKDHLNLLRAFKRVVQKIPEAHLILAGAGGEAAYQARLRQMMAEIDGHVTWLGPRNDVGSILASCDVGVLSSVSEGLPLALIEYGMAGLPVVATNVGQCGEVLENGRAGLLVPPGDSAALADAIVSLLTSPCRRILGEILRQRVRASYSESGVIAQVRRIYEEVLTGALAAHSRV